LTIVTDARQRIPAGKKGSTTNDRRKGADEFGQKACRSVAFGEIALRLSAA